MFRLDTPIAEWYDNLDFKERGKDSCISILVFIKSEEALPQMCIVNTKSE